MLLCCFVIAAGAVGQCDLQPLPILFAAANGTSAPVVLLLMLPQSIVNVIVDALLMLLLPLLPIQMLYRWKPSPEPPSYQEDDVDDEKDYGCLKGLDNSFPQISIYDSPKVESTTVETKA